MNSLSVVHTLTEGPTGLGLTETNSSVRRIGLPKITVAALKRIAPKDRTRFVFRASQGGILRKSNFIRRVFHKLIEDAKVRKIPFHALRHTANTFFCFWRA